MRTHVAPKLTGAFCAAVVLSLAPRGASANDVFALRIEGGYGSMVARDERAGRRFDQTWLGSARLALNITDGVALEAGVSNWVFPSEVEGTGWIFAPSAGLRFEPRISTVGRLWFDTHAGVGFTGDLSRFVFDVGVGFELRAGRYFAIGPSLRYGQMVQPDTLDGAPRPFPSDVRYVSGGITLALRLGSSPASNDPSPTQRTAPPREARAADEDTDGVPDRDDVCPTVPQGARPDVNRVGCPTLDSDFDTVFDPDDQCVTVPQGPRPDPRRPGCPAADDDRDDVLNDADQCPQVPAGAHPDPQRPGCPDGDRDGDGVYDSADQCVDTPETPNGVLDDDGCPDTGTPAIAQLDPQQQVISLRGTVSFLPNSNTIVGRSSYETLDGLANLLLQNTAIELVEIQGHTDARGRREDNLALSRRRAETVVQYVVSRGVSPTRLRATGFGPDRPLDRRQTPEAWTTNRRTEVHVIRVRQEPSAAR